MKKKAARKMMMKNLSVHSVKKNTRHRIVFSWKMMKKNMRQPKKNRETKKYLLRNSSVSNGVQYHGLPEYIFGRTIWCKTQPGFKRALVTAGAKVTSSFVGAIDIALHGSVAPKSLIFIELR